MKLNNQIYLLFNVVRSLTISRLTNISKLFISYILSKYLRKNFHHGKPFSLSIEPTTSCNLGCLECPSGQKKFSRPTGKMNLEMLEDIIQQSRKNLWYVTLYFQGEPLLNTNLPEMISRLKREKIIVGTSTNAHFLTRAISKKIIQSKLDRLIISLDGTKPETYAKYRIGGNYNLVIENIKHFLQERKLQKTTYPFVELQFIVFKHNEHQINEIKLLGKELGVDKVSIKTAQIYDYEMGNPLIPTEGKYSRYKKGQEGTFVIKSKLPNSCKRMWSSAVVTWDGKVVPCCFDKDASYQFGNLRENSFDKIWKSKDYNSFRNRILDNRSSIDICKNCTEGIKI